mgnify:CR=1 FL=1
MNTLKVLYYRMKQKGANLCFYYWHKKAEANIKNTKKWNAYFKHMMYWLDKIVKCNIAMHKELGS